ncbi:MAG TPA: LysR family transcriptional regulator [Microbacterium sp.]|nr:LysR family transcriptional regulator [Microbacterium sp.]
MELRQLQIFLRVAEEQSISRAAELLHLAQPSVSQAIRQLESELRGELFLRSRRGVSLTAAGHSLVEPARQMLRDLVVAKESVADVLGLKGGNLHIAAVPALAVDPLAPMLGAYRRRYPDVKLHIIDPADVADTPSYVRSGRCEIGLVENIAPQPGLCLHELDAQEIVLILPPGAAVATDQVSWEELARFEFVTSPPGRSVSRSRLDYIFGKTGKELRICVESDHRTAISEFVLAGAGAALLRRPLAAAIVERGARAYPLQPRLEHQVTLIHRDRTLSPAARAFVRLASLQSGRGEPECSSYR